MFYDKQIRYLEYLENGEKIRSAGFVKIEVMDQLCNIQVNVTGLHPSENCTREVHISSAVSEKGTAQREMVQGVLGSVTLQSGKGNLLCRRLPTGRLCEGISYEDLGSIRINLGKNRELLCRWRECESREEERKEQERKEQERQEQEKQERVADEFGVIELNAAEAIPSQTDVAEAVKKELYVEKPVAEKLMAAEAVPAEPVTTEAIAGEPLVVESFAVKPTVEEPTAIKPAEKQQAVIEPQNEESQPTEEMQQDEEMQPTGPSMPPRLSEDKWKQLADIYPHIYPFHDDRDYLSIGPGDFVILPKKYYRLISNSFLLHGFYNYGHLILARTVKRGEEIFYLGVPGNFFEREKQVAIMFGFESFECKKEPAMDGDFGYFMIKVEL